MRLLAVPLVFVAAILIWTAMWFLDGEPDQPGPGTPLAAAAMADGTAPRDHHAEPSDLPTRVERQELDDPQGGDRTEPVETIQVTGTFLVVDAHGVTHARTNGTFDATFHRMVTRTNGGLTSIFGGSLLGGSRTEVTVKDGRFKLQAPVGWSLHVDNATLEGRPVRLSPSTYEVASGTVEICARWPAQTMLRVLDAVTGVDLSAVTVIRKSDSRWEGVTHSGPWPQNDLLAEKANSPLVIPNPDPGQFQFVDVLVGAPGHVWGEALLGFSTGGEHVVELEPGADLEVLLVGELPSPSKENETTTYRDKEKPAARLRLRMTSEAEPPPSIEKLMGQLRVLPDIQLPGSARPSEREVRRLIETRRERKSDREARPMFFDTARTGDPILWQGLPPGSYEVSVELHQKAGIPVVLGRVNARLQAGRTTNVQIELTPPHLLETVPLGGPLILPAGSKIGEVTPLYLQPLDDLPFPEPIRVRVWDAVPGNTTTGRYRWDAGMVPPGRYTVRFRSLEFEVAVDTGSRGRRDLAIKVPTVADVTVQLIDEHTSLPLRIGLNWQGEGTSAGLTSGAPDDVKWDAATEQYRFRAPLGVVQFSLADERFQLVDASPVTLTAGQNSFSLAVRRSR